MTDNTDSQPNLITQAIQSLQSQLGTMPLTANQDNSQPSIPPANTGKHTQALISALSNPNTALSQGSANDSSVNAEQNNHAPMANSIIPQNKNGTNLNNKPENWGQTEDNSSWWPFGGKLNTDPSVFTEGAPELNGTGAGITKALGKGAANSVISTVNLAPAAVNTAAKAVQEATGNKPHDIVPSAPELTPSSQDEANIMPAGSVLGNAIMAAPSAGKAAASISQGASDLYNAAKAGSALDAAKGAVSPILNSAAKGTAESAVVTPIINNEANTSKGDTDAPLSENGWLANAAISAINRGTDSLPFNGDLRKTTPATPGFEAFQRAADPNGTSYSRQQGVRDYLYSQSPSNGVSPDNIKSMRQNLVNDYPLSSPYSQDTLADIQNNLKQQQAKTQDLNNQFNSAATVNRNSPYANVSNEDLAAKLQQAPDANTASSIQTEMNNRQRQQDLASQLFKSQQKETKLNNSLNRASSQAQSDNADYNRKYVNGNFNSKQNIPPYTGSANSKANRQMAENIAPQYEDTVTQLKNNPAKGKEQGMAGNITRGLGSASGAMLGSGLATAMGLPPYVGAGMGDMASRALGGFIDKLTQGGRDAKAQAAQKLNAMNSHPLYEASPVKPRAETSQSNITKGLLGKAGNIAVQEPIMNNGNNQPPYTPSSNSGETPLTNNSRNGYNMTGLPMKGDSHAVGNIGSGSGGNGANGVSAGGNNGGYSGGGNGQPANNGNHGALGSILKLLALGALNGGLGYLASGGGMSSANPGQWGYNISKRQLQQRLLHNNNIPAAFADNDAFMRQYGDTMAKLSVSPFGMGNGAKGTIQDSVFGNNGTNNTLPDREGIVHAPNGTTFSVPNNYVSPNPNDPFGSYYVRNEDGTLGLKYVDPTKNTQSLQAQQKEREMNTEGTNAQTSLNNAEQVYGNVSEAIPQVDTGEKDKHGNAVMRKGTIADLPQWANDGTITQKLNRAAKWGYNKAGGSLSPYEQAQQAVDTLNEKLGAQSQNIYKGLAGKGAQNQTEDRMAKGILSIPRLDENSPETIRARIHTDAEQMAQAARAGITDAQKYGNADPAFLKRQSQKIFQTLHDQFGYTKDDWNNTFDGMKDFQE